MSILLKFVFCSHMKGLFISIWEFHSLKNDKKETKNEEVSKICFMTCFYIWWDEKKASSLCRYPENNLFTLKKTNTY